MDDIKITLSTDEKLRAPSIEAEKEWLEEEGELWYPVGPRCPRRAKEGCWVYFVRGGHLVARGRADEFTPPPTESKFSYTGEEDRTSGWEVRISAMELATRRIQHKGFRGFRYVTPEEKADFEAAFKPTSSRRKSRSRT